MIRGSNAMKNSVLFTKFQEFFWLESSNAVHYNRMGETEMREIFLQELDRWFPWHRLSCVNAGICGRGVGKTRHLYPRSWLRGQCAGGSLSQVTSMDGLQQQSTKLKNKPKIGNSTGKQAQNALAGKFNKTKNQQACKKNQGGKSEKRSPKWSNFHKNTAIMPLAVHWNTKSAIKVEKKAIWKTKTCKKQEIFN